MEQVMPLLLLFVLIPCFTVGTGVSDDSSDDLITDAADAANVPERAAATRVLVPETCALASPLSPCPYRPTHLAPPLSLRPPLEQVLVRPDAPGHALSSCTPPPWHVHARAPVLGL